MSTPTRNPTPSDPSTPGTTSRKAKTIVWVVLAAVVLAGLIARPLAEAGTAEPGWDLTGSDEVASLVVDGMPQGVLTEEHLSVEDQAKIMGGNLGRLVTT